MKSYYVRAKNCTVTGYVEAHSEEEAIEIFDKNFNNENVVEDLCLFAVGEITAEQEEWMGEWEDEEEDKEEESVTN